MSVHHTPGPWRVLLDEPYDAQRPTHYLEDQDGHQLMLLARLPEVGPEQHTANLRLIAAAPLMQVALETAERARQHADMYECGCDGDCPEALEMWAAFTEQAKAALALAKGGAS
jgi:hypothetical protein